MRTGLRDFRLSMGKALVPIAFACTPALLLIDFNWGSAGWHLVDWAATPRQATSTANERGVPCPPCPNPRSPATSAG